MNDLKFSVAMCVYGKDDPVWFKTAVDSIIDQTAKPNEVVLVVDGPVPEELDSIIKNYEKDDRFAPLCAVPALCLYRLRQQ